MHYFYFSFQIIACLNKGQNITLQNNILTIYDHLQNIEATIPLEYIPENIFCFQNYIVLQVQNQLQVCRIEHQQLQIIKQIQLPKQFIQYITLSQQLYLISSNEIQIYNQQLIQTTIKLKYQLINSQYIVFDHDLIYIDENKLIKINLQNTNKDPEIIVQMPSQISHLQSTKNFICFYCEQTKQISINVYRNEKFHTDYNCDVDGQIQQYQLNQFDNQLIVSYLNNNNLLYVYQLQQNNNQLICRISAYKKIIFYKLSEQKHNEIKLNTVLYTDISQPALIINTNLYQNEEIINIEDILFLLSNQKQDVKENQIQFIQNRQQIFKESLNQTECQLEQAIRLEDYQQIDQIIADKNYQEYEQLNQDLKNWFINYLLQKFTPDSIKWLVNFKDEWSVNQRKDDIWLKFYELQQQQQNLYYILEQMNIKDDSSTENTGIQINEW